MQQAGPNWDLRSLTTLPNCLAMGVILFVFLVPIVKLLRRTAITSLVLVPTLAGLEPNRNSSKPRSERARAGGGEHLRNCSVLPKTHFRQSVQNGPYSRNSGS